MNVTNFQGLVYGTVLGAALLAAPALSSAQDASTTTVNCNDGTSSHGGRGACSGHGGVNKAAAVAGQQAAQSATEAAAPAAPATAASSSASSGSVTCKDGTSSKGGKGACSGHGGVNKTAASAAAPAAAAAPATAAASTTATTMVPCNDEIGRASCRERVCLAV